MGITEKLKHMHILEEDDKSASPKPHEQQVAHVDSHVAQQAAVVAPTTEPMTSAHYPYPTIAPVEAVASDKLQKLRDKTNFDATEVGALLRKFLVPLEGLGLDEKTKYKAALATANAQQGLTADKVLETFDTLLTTLHGEQGNFQRALDQFESKEIKDRQNRLKQVSDQIAQKKKELEDLTAQLSVVSGQLARAQQDEQQVQNDFSKAMQARATEISQQKERYSTLLK
jgi:hypothetical protein